MVDVAEIVSEISKSKKYSDVSLSVVERICHEMACKYSKKKEILKAAKKELHIIHESFFATDSHKDAVALIDQHQGETLLKDKAVSLQLMELHSSTKERVVFANDIYVFLQKHITPNTTLADIGCGFNPLSLPLLQIQPKCYSAFEINQRTIDMLNLYFNKINKDNYKAYMLDAVTDVPDEKFDLIFLFKLLPVLQQQKKGRAFEILNELKFKKAIISFPIKSLSGKEKGMEKFYSSFFESGLSPKFKIIEKNILGNELFYVIEEIK